MDETFTSPEVDSLRDIYEAARDFVENEEGHQERLGARWYALADAIRRHERALSPAKRAV